jgi:hypothetical protein
VILNWNPPKIAAQKAAYKWSAPHALIVHEGAVMANGTVLPARRWTDFAIAQNPVAQTMVNHHRSSDSIDLAFRATAETLNSEFRSAIETPIWNWPRTTKRSNGDVVGSPRDAVDTGELINAQSMRIEVTHG